MATEINYNGTVIGSLKSGQTATLACAGKKAAGNITVAFDSAGGITYNGLTTEVESGKTATLQCAGKKMTSDVYVAVEAAEDALAGTWVFNDSVVFPDVYSYEGYILDNSSPYSGVIGRLELIDGTSINITCDWYFSNHNNYWGIRYLKGSGLQFGSYTQIFTYTASQLVGATLTLNENMYNVQYVKVDTLLSFLQANATKQ